MVKGIWMMKRKPDMTAEEFLTRYKQHGPLALRLIPGIKRYVQNYAASLSSRGEPRYDGITEIWFEDLDAWRKARDWEKTEAGRPVREDGEKFIDASRSAFVLVEESLVGPKP
jgi:uncharacterized protein (TIGR02118 family)